MKRLDPDYSNVFTGIFRVSDRYRQKPSLILIERLVQVAPVYYEERKSRTELCQGLIYM